MEIIQVALGMFIEKGYSATTFKMIADELDTSSGHIAFYFPSKDALLAELVEMMCSFQWKMMKEEANDGVSALLAVCLELMSMAAACEEDKIAKDFLVSAYRSDICLAIIQKNDCSRAKEVFAEYCPDWTDEQFRNAESLVVGIEYSTLNAVDESVRLEARITGALNTIMTIYNVPEEIRKKKIEKVIALNYRNVGKRIFKEFKEYIEQTTEQAFDELLE
jgi:AcrR family transcriptional regulator